MISNPEETELIVIIIVKAVSKPPSVNLTNSRTKKKTNQEGKKMNGNRKEVVVKYASYNPRFMNF